VFVTPQEAQRRDEQRADAQDRMDPTFGDCPVWRSMRRGMRQAQRAKAREFLGRRHQSVRKAAVPRRVNACAGRPARRIERHRAQATSSNDPGEPDTALVTYRREERSA
jgi:hypothetical protein